nr:TPA_asm: hypothetical protein HUJ06_001081 [Nelumbo nucifera]
MPQRDLASWNSVLSSYSASPNSWFEALVLFKTMVVNGIGVDGITLAVVLSGCTKVGDTRCGRSIHGYLIKLGIRRNLKLENAVLGMYAKGCDMDSAIQLFHEMVDRRDVASHTILINGYTELGLIDLARCIFDQMPVKDLISWNSMIHGYVKAKRPKDALELFEKMEKEFVTPDETTIVSVLSACSSLSELQLGRLVHHRFIMQRNIRIDVFVGTALIDMYAKCGSLEEAVKAFYKMEHKDIFTWTALITGFASYGLGHKALRLFEQMEKEGIEPNETTFVAALTACSRSGLLEEGLLLFGRMVEIYKIQPKIEHFYCLIDLLSRGGLLYQAEEFIEAMATEDRVIAYKTLLSSCMIYSDISLGEKIAEQLVKLGSQNHEVYVLLANFYALTGKWNKAVEIRSSMKEFDMRKKAGISFIQVENIENSQAYESKEMTNYPV